MAGKKNYNEIFAEAISKRDFDGLASNIENLHDKDGVFYVDEGHLHDYKREYPFSNSDNYFAGILRLICALHNSYGGLILFGVHDKTRLAGQNKVRVDSEKINRKFRELLSRDVQINSF